MGLVLKFPPPVDDDKDEGEDDKEEKDEKETKKDDAKSNQQPADKKRKVKAKLAKKTGKEVYQWKIMQGMGVAESEIAKFADAKYWLSYFPPIGRDHLKKFGVCVDFRRSFITTDVNPYYDSFVQWHFMKLKKKDKIAFGNRPAIFSPIDNQACADHDRSEGEGVGIADYTLIKVILQQPYPEALTKILSAAKIPSNVSIVLPAATFRPETMYGQTNCWLLPDGEYGVYSMNDSEVFICAPRSALNMSYQGLTRVRGKPEEIGKIFGQTLMGCPIKSPHAQYEKMYILPLLTIKMDKGTGVVTSVPSDAPDDYQALQDLKSKKPLREKYHIKDEQVLPFEPVPIINTPGLGDLPAPSVCVEMKIQSQNDRVKLEEAKEKVYNLGFAKGEMKVGKYAGEKVMDAKGKIKQDMLDAKLALPYSEPMSRVVSRSGNECVVALCDQWYLKYGEEHWRNAIRSHVENTLDTYTEQAKSDFLKTIGWMHEWACSRAYGLGTRLPWDNQYLIESLSDSTIYMAYYAVSHLLQGGVLEGNVTGPAGITPSQLTEDVWDYIFIKDAPFPSSTTIPKETLDKLRNEFRYWYPMNLRVSGKDLINNHLTMSLYNHAAVWDNEPSLWPRSFFANGHVLVDKKKMSKSEGNFITLQQAIIDFGSDATRLALAEAGDGLDDANFEKKNANAAILRLTKEEKFVEDVLADLKDGKLREGEMDFIDQVFDNEISKAIMDTDHNYSRMQYRYALKSGVFDLHISRDNYRIAQSKPFHKDLILRFIRVSTQLITPFCPHYAQHIWQLAAFNKETPFIIKAPWPQASSINVMLMRKMNYIRSTNVMLRDSLNTAVEAIKKKNSKGKGPKEPEQLNALVLFVVSEYKEWQQKVIAVVSKLIEAAEKKINASSSKDEQKESSGKSVELIDRKDLMAALRSEFQSELEADKEAAKIKGAAVVPGMPAPGKFLEEAMKFSSQIIAEYAIVGAQALETRTPFNELELLAEHKSLIIRDIPVDESKVIFAAASDAELKYKQLFNVNVSAAKAAPGKPAPVFFSSH